MPLFVDEDENGGKTGNEKSHYDGNEDDQVERRKILSWEKEQPETIISGNW